MTTTYSIYSCRVTVEAWPELAAAVRARLARFIARRPTSCRLTISFVATRELEQRQTAEAARLVYEFPNGHVAYDDASECLVIVVGGRIHGVCHASQGAARISVAAPLSGDTWVLSHPILSVVLMETLKRHGFFAVHAAGVGLSGAGVLFAGTSGVGKSTLAVALARSGSSFLSDDTLFLEAVEESGWRVRAFPDEIDLCPDAPAFFPELQTLAGHSRAEWPKFQCRAEQLYGAVIPSAIAPRIIMFPTIRHERATTIRPMTAAAALLALAPNVLLTDARTSQRHFDALAGLVAQCACYHLDTGQNLDEAVRVIREVAAA